MRRLLYLAGMILLFCPFLSSAQIDVMGKVKNKVKERADRKVDEGIDKSLDKTEEEATKSGKDEKEGEKSAGENKAGEGEATEEGKSETASAISYANYDFVPGDKIIFEDPVDGETPGEFPSKWDLGGGRIEVATVGGHKAIGFLEGNYAVITPLMEKAGDYLPERFTIEFDQYVKSSGYPDMRMSFFNEKDPTYKEEELGDYKDWYIQCGAQAEAGAAQGSHPDIYSGYHDKWHHIAIAYNKGSIKIYTDQHRLAMLPRSTGNPQQIKIAVLVPEEKNAVYIRNIRIAAGGGDLYKRVTTDGKIVSRGILFDVNKATIKPQSMGALNEIASLMKDHPELKFEIGGHTDSDGDEQANLKLSQERADAVKKQLSSMGIDASRLNTKGLGESKPVDNNNSPEGKANNRRVEFVKI